MSPATFDPPSAMENSPPKKANKESVKKVIIGALLALCSLALYWQTLGFNFVNFDDTTYVFENPHIREGLTLPGLKTAFFGEKYLWIPLVWVSYMLDFELWGLDPAGYHLTNTLLHAANSVLVFLVLARLTGSFGESSTELSTESSERSLWASAFVGAVFAVHPLHVESVAWITERKDVLFVLFWILAIWAYVRYTESPSIRRYLPVAALFTLSLMSKPMAVTLPLVLLCLDFWPLGRLVNGSALKRLILEKIPLLALSTGCMASTYLLALGDRGVVSFDTLPFWDRIPNALSAFVAYVYMALWPVELAVFYPHPLGLQPLWKPVGSALILLCVSAFALRGARTRPWLAVGWLWFLVTLVPVIGIVQSGRQALADRFMYVPLIGLSIIVAWGVPALARMLRINSLLITLTAALTLSALTVCTHLQLRHWQNSETLFTRALAVTEDNYLAHNNLGDFFAKAGRADSAIAHYTAALRINPAFKESHSHLGDVYDRLGDREKALAHYKQVIRLSATQYSEMGDISKLTSRHRKSLRANPEDANTHSGLAKIYAEAGLKQAALEEFKEVARLLPLNPVANFNLGLAYMDNGLKKDAMVSFKKVLELTPEDPEARKLLDELSSD